MSAYNREPEIRIEGFEMEAWSGYEAIGKAIGQKVSDGKCVITIECYPTVRTDEIMTNLKKILNPETIIFSDACAISQDEMNAVISEQMTDDRVFGVMTHYTLDRFFDNDKISEAQQEIEAITSGVILVYGVGASLIHKGDVKVYSDIARWEIQARYRTEEFGNWNANNHEEEILKKYKRGYFFEWRMADRLKKEYLQEIDFYLDTNKKDAPVMITREALFSGMKQATNQPFRLVPYFDPGVWGGQWMKDVCNLDKSKSNYAWSFDGVPEENSVYMRFGDIRVEMPSINIVHQLPKQLLGEKVHARFGTEFPIRFDFLDTMGGQHLSLQVHPLTEYIKENFGMHYTQDESYYMLDAGEDAVVYLGVKEECDQEAMLHDLRESEKGSMSFPDEKYINQFPAKKHDHFLIPAGTIHCSGKNSMVLEISATPYIFTFKLWDWDRLGLDGKPRPVHIDHGEKNIQWDRDTKWVEENLINDITLMAEGDGWKEERTGLHEREFIETRRHWFSKPVLHTTNGTVNMLNLIEGTEAIVESPTGVFEPFIIHYAETFIIPAHIEEYTIRPYGVSEGQELATLKAYVRG